MDLSLYSTSFLLTVSLLGCISNWMMNTVYAKRKLRTKSDVYLVTMVSTFVTTVMMLFLWVTDPQGSVFTLQVGLGFGIAAVSSTLFSNLAITEGPISLTRILLNLSTLITALSGWIFWDESFSVLMAVGLLLLVVSFVLCVGKDRESGKKGSGKWLLYLCLSIFSSAGIGLLQKVHQMSAHADELYYLLFISFVIASAFSAVMYLLSRGKKEERAALPGIPISFFAAACLICGIGNGLNFVLNTYLCGVMRSAVFFPIVNGIPLLAILVLSFLFFREKLEKRQLVGFIVGSAAMVCLFAANMIS